VDPEARNLIEAVARRHGREFAAVAYLVLDNREAAERCAAAGIADVLRSGGAVQADDVGLRRAMVGATLRRALEADRALREVDPLPNGSSAASLARLNASQRAVAAGHLLAELDIDGLAAAVGLPISRITYELASAEVEAGGRHVLRRWLRHHVDGRAFWITPKAVAASWNLPPPARPKQRRAPALAFAAVALLLTAGGIAALIPDEHGVPGASDLPAAAAFDLAGRGTPPGGGLPTRGPEGAAAVLPPGDQLALAECGIQPASTPVSYRGWLSLAAVSGTASEATAGTPVYALVTATTAERAAWQAADGRPMLSRPVGRMACVVDPVTRRPGVFSVANNWEPPRPIDGCPATPISQYGGERQIGGPHAFVVLPWNGVSWWVDDPTLSIRVRIAPTPAVDAHISATLQSLDGTPGSLLEVETTPIPSGRPPTSSHYLRLRDVRFPSEGCWLVRVSVDGAVVGAAILPVAERPA
jgi:hypothetical protein